MEIDPVIFWNVVLTLIIAPAVWAFRNMMAEVKRIDILLNRTREDYASRAEVKDEMQVVMDALHRLEDKLDRVLSRENRMLQFQGFKPSGMEKIANAMGFQGDQKQFQQFLQDNPDRQAEMLRYQDIARKMAEGGVVKKMQEGGATDKDNPTNVSPTAPIADVTAERLSAPALPEAGVVSPVLTRDEAGTYIPPTTGQLTGERKAGTFFAETEKADDITQTPISTVEPEKVTPEVTDVVETLEAYNQIPMTLD